MSSTLYWMQAGGCGGDTLSLLSAESPDLLEAIRLLDLEVLWHPTLSRQTAAEHTRVVEEISGGTRPLDVLCVEGAVLRGPGGTGMYDTVGGKPKKDRIEALARRARFVANPGCYPTSIILGLAPALKSSWIDPDSIIADSKSGVSGAGREPQIGSLYCEVEGGFKAYKVASHRHTPEIEQELGLLAGREMKISFTPHLLPVKRGILSTIYAKLTKDVTAAEATALYQAFYKDEPFVRVSRPGQFPNLASVVGSNFCDIGVTVNKRTGRMVVVSVIDNLIKGASGQAIQNMNLIFGLDERTGLPGVALFP